MFFFSPILILPNKGEEVEDPKLVINLVRNATIASLRAVPVQQPIQTFTPIEVKNFGISNNISSSTNLVSTAITNNIVAVLPPSSSVISSPVPSFAITPIAAPKAGVVSPNVIAAPSNSPSIKVSVPVKPFQTLNKATPNKGTNVK